MVALSGHGWQSWNSTDGASLKVSWEKKNGHLINSHIHLFSSIEKTHPVPHADEPVVTRVPIPASANSLSCDLRSCLPWALVSSSVRARVLDLCVGPLHRGTRQAETVT